MKNTLKTITTILIPNTPELRKKIVGWRTKTHDLEGAWECGIDCFLKYFSLGNASK